MLASKVFSQVTNKSYFNWKSISTLELELIPLEFLTNTHNWQLFIPINFQFASLFQHMMLVNVNLDISGHHRIIFQGCRLHWSSSFAMAQLK